MTNIREIARLAGVSVSTVSRVINNHPYVRQDKREAVLRIMEELDYSPNVNAVHLSRGKTSMIGVVLPTINHPYFSELLEGIAEEAIKHDIQLVLFQTGYNEKKELEALEQLRGHLIDGVIFCSRALDFDLLMNYKGIGPIVLCEDADQKAFPAVSINHVEAFNLGLDYLFTNGHKKIAICLGRLEGTNSRKRIEAYKGKLKKSGQKLRSDWMIGNCLMIEDGKKVFDLYLKWSEKPTAFLVGNDQVAAGLKTEAIKSGMKIPDEMAIISFDNHPVSELMDITTIEIPTKQLGISAFKAFIEQSRDIHFSEKIALPYRLIARGSV